MVITGDIPTVNTSPNPVQDDNDNEEGAEHGEDGWQKGVKGAAWAGADQLCIGQILVTEGL